MGPALWFHIYHLLVIFHVVPPHEYSSAEVYSRPQRAAESAPGRDPEPPLWRLTLSAREGIRGSRLPTEAPRRRRCDAERDSGPGAHGAGVCALWEPHGRRAARSRGPTGARARGGRCACHHPGALPHGSPRSDAPGSPQPRARDLAQPRTGRITTGSARPYYPHAVGNQGRAPARCGADIAFPKGRVNTSFRTGQGAREARSTARGRWGEEEADRAGGTPCPRGPPVRRGRGSAAPPSLPAGRYDPVSDHKEPGRFGIWD